MGPPREVTYFTLAYFGKIRNNLLSETTLPRALIFGKWHHPVDLYLYPWGQNWPRHGAYMFYIGLHREIMKNIFLSETTKSRALTFGM